MSHHILHNWSQKFHISLKNIAFTLNGDFNSLPDSEVYAYITQSNPKFKNPPNRDKQLLKISKQDKSFSALFGPTTTSLTLMKPSTETGIQFIQKKNPFGGLASGFKSVAGCEPAFTNSDRNNTYTLDYVFYNDEKLKPVGCLDLPPIEMVDFKNKNMMPVSEVFPSDHFPIYITFSWK